MSVLHEIWLCELCNYEPEQIYKYLSFFGSAENAYNAKPSDYKKYEEYPLMKKFIKANKSLLYAEKILEDCRRQEISVMSIQDEDYPHYLKNGFLPPRVLFIKGERINLNNYLTLSIVGSRAATRNGKLMAFELAQDLTKSGFLIMSGLARGIDAEAHKGALSIGGKTVAFLAGGVDIIYPTENRELYYQILENGAIISERPPGTVAKPYFYQQRNRIMAYLSYGTILVEGEKISGTSITAKHATEGNRDLFAIPGNPKVSQSELPNSLIKDGAKMVLSYEDVIIEYIDKYPELLSNGLEYLSIDEDDVILDLNYDLDDMDKLIINFIKNYGEAVFPDTICEELNIPINIISSKLTLLMMSGILSQEPGNKYLLTRR